MIKPTQKYPSYQPLQHDTRVLFHVKFNDSIRPIPTERKPFPEGARKDSAFNTYNDIRWSQASFQENSRSMSIETRTTSIETKSAMSILVAEATELNKKDFLAEAGEEAGVETHSMTIPTFKPS
ncbi:hypothetical protein NC653_037634 [Populus alba x Populus x berolinensis]|uniref:Uncharacterized protein n=1 Tax=Populus alba x Populus x berolinensis TaxID=444605 RepID=A0AAD6LET4_9ROSI|nr:hypothetical protein NC653_037634 [Populus alba x Populus x berolinensis]